MNRLYTIALTLCLFIFVTACSSLEVAPPPPTIEVYDPSAEDGTQWDRDPATIVFRSDLTGGAQDPFLVKNEIPFCTVYGDNRVVWTNEVGYYHTEVLYDQVPDEAIRIFADYLILGERLYDYDAKAHLQIPEDVSPVIEIMQLNVNNAPFTTDTYGGWDYQYYMRILERCRTISKSPVLFSPDAAWLSARQVNFQTHIPLIAWNANAANLSLRETAEKGEPVWITGNNAAILWNVLRTSPIGIQLVEDNITYQIALQVPNITRDSPPAP